MKVDIEVDELDEDGNYVLDESGLIKQKVVAIDIPDLNHYFKDNARKSSSIDFTYEQYWAIYTLLTSPDSEYKLDENYIYGYDVENGKSPKIKSEYLYTLFNKQTLYSDLFTVEHSRPFQSQPFSKLRFNKEDFEFEVDLGPELIINKYDPTFGYTEESFTTISKNIENGKTVETIKLVENTTIHNGFELTLDPTKFKEEYFHSIQGKEGKLIRTYELSMIDGVETNRQLIDYELTPSQTNITVQGIRNGQAPHIGGK